MGLGNLVGVPLAGDTTGATNRGAVTNSPAHNAQLADMVTAGMCV